MRSLGLLLLVLMTVTGCYGKRDPVPSHAIIIAGDTGSYRLDGQPMALDQLQKELTEISRKTRRSDGTTRVLLRVATDPGADYQRTVDLMDWCAVQGLTNIELSSR